MTDMDEQIKAAHKYAFKEH